MNNKKIILIPAALCFILASCGPGSGTSESSSKQESTSSQTSSSGDSSSSQSTKNHFEGLSFADVTCTYDGNSHQIGELTGAPDGATVTYTGRDAHVDAGTYNATATVEKEGYETKTLSATLKINPASFNGLTYLSSSFNYDGLDHFDSVKLTGTQPEGTNTTQVVKDKNGNVVTKAVDAGTYSYSMEVTNKNYTTKTLNATLTINPLDFNGLTYSDVSITYDGLDHFNDIQLVGVQPNGTDTNQTVKDSNGNDVTSAIEVGTYSYTMNVTNKNYNPKTLNATLTIKPLRSPMPVYRSSNGTIFFANGLDNKYLYSYDTVNGIKRVDFSTPTEFNKYGDTALFISKSLLMNSVKEVNGSAVNVIYTDSNIDDFVKASDGVYYYSSNSLSASKSGIYKVDATNSDSEPVVTKVFSGKTDNLAINGTNLYFTNGNDKDYLYKMNLSSYTTSKVIGEKVHEYIINNNKLYCTVDGLLNDYIGYIDLTSLTPSVTKLSNAAGEFLTIKNNKLYYNYTDLLGKVDATKLGIWSIDLSSNEETQIVKTQNVNGFDVESSTYLDYIDTTNLHLYRYNMLSDTKVDLLDGFVVPETTPLNIGGKSVAYNDKVYYLNMYAGKTLYCYDEKTKKNNQLTTNKVQDFFIHDDKLYFNQVTMLTNNDLYCVSLTKNEEAVKISSNDVRNMITDGTYIYSTHYNWAGVAGGISRMKLDGTDYVKFSDVDGAKNLTIKDGKLYFINCATVQDNGNIEYIDLSSITTTSEDLESTNLSKKIKNVKQFIFDGDNIYYIYNGLTDNSIKKTTFTSLEEGVAIASNKTNPNEMILHGNDIYYYSFAATAMSYAGFYKVSKNANEDKTQELIAGYESKYFGSDLAITSSNNLYFLNYIPKLVMGDAHTYKLDLDKKEIEKIA